MLNELSALIAERLRRETERLRTAFEHPQGVSTRCAVLNDVLPPEIAASIYEAFPPVAQMRLMSSFRERKYTSKALDTMAPLIGDAIFAFQAPEVIAEVARIAGVRDMVGDPQLYAGGISAMTRGQFLNPRIDNSHDSERRNYRVLNLLYYVTPDWKGEFGGSLELWDTAVRRRVEFRACSTGCSSRRPISIPGTPSTGLPSRAPAAACPTTISRRIRRPARRCTTSPSSRRAPSSRCCVCSPPQTATRGPSCAGSSVGWGGKTCTAGKHPGADRRADPTCTGSDRAGCHFLTHFQRTPPGLVGAGAGLPLGEYYIGPWAEARNHPLQHPNAGAYTRKDFSGFWAQP